MKLSFLTPFTALALSLMTIGCSSDAPYDPSGEGIVICPGEIDLNLINEQNDFAFKYFKNIPTDDNGNIVISPLSLSMTLAMAANGAEGETLDEILRVIGSDNTSLRNINSQNSFLINVFPQLDPKTTLSLANALWIHKDFSVKEQFRTLCADTYNAEVNNIDMYSPAAKDIINKWAEQHTNGLIKNFLSEEPRKVLSIMNALYFKGQWSDKFSKSDTRKAAFHNADGRNPQVSMMHDSNHVCGTLMDGGTMVVSLPYGNKAFRMTIIVPEEGTTTDQYAAHLTTEKWLGWQDDLLREGTRDLKMPKFDIESQNEPIEMLRKLGMTRAFGDGAEFSGIAEGLQISSIKQKTHIIVDESGTEAAAVTDIGFDLTIAQPGTRTIVVDRPFIFIISESGSSSILFMGKINNL